MHTRRRSERVRIGISVSSGVGTSCVEAQQTLGQELHAMWQFLRIFSGPSSLVCIIKMTQTVEAKGTLRTANERAQHDTLMNIVLVEA